LGGANASRGFGSQRLSPALRDCQGDTCSNIPIGGYSMVQGTFELRFTLFGPLALVGFAELGDVKKHSFSYDAATWNYTAGPGLRLKTPLGLVRGDIGFRLNRLDAYPGEPGYAFYVGLGEAL
jgi:outer membrane protein insertion porin family